MQMKCNWLPTNRLTAREPFKGLFPINQDIFETVAEHMRANGYDESQPIIGWKEDPEKPMVTVIDGHIRLGAALKSLVSPVYVALMDFPDERTALEYAIHYQRDRRNINDADLYRCIMAVDKPNSWGGDRKSAAAKIKSSIEPLISSAKATADIVGTSETKVKKARTVSKHPKAEQALLEGKKSIHAAATKIQEKREGEKPKSRPSHGIPVETGIEQPKDIIVTTCPNCGHTLALDKATGETALVVTEAESKDKELVVF